MADTDYSPHYSDSGFWDKVKTSAKAAGKGVLEQALKMYYSAKDPDTPLWAKTTVFGALGYFISPIDAIPDMIPVVGFSDDLTILLAAAAAVAAHIKAEHSQKAQETLQAWFGK